MARMGPEIGTARSRCTQFGRPSGPSALPRMVPHSLHSTNVLSDDIFRGYLHYRSTGGWQERFRVSRHRVRVCVDAVHHGCDITIVVAAEDALEGYSTGRVFAEEVFGFSQPHAWIGVLEVLDLSWFWWYPDLRRLLALFTLLR